MNKGTTSWLESLEKGGNVNPELVEEEKEEIQNSEEEETPAEEESDNEEFYSFYEEEEDAPVEGSKQPSQEEQADIVKAKTKLDVKNYIQEHKDKLKTFLEYSSLDLEKLSNEEALTLKLRRDNPSWSEQDIKEELKDRYGIGLKLKEIPEDAFDEEVERINNYNDKIKAQIAKGERQMKSDVLQAKKELDNLRSELDLPEWEVEVEAQSQFSSEQVIQDYLTQAEAKQKEFIENEWIPSVNTEVDRVSGIKERVEVELTDGEKGFSEVTYRLTKEQKEELKSYLSSYVAQPSDQKYVKEDGSVDMQRFIADKIKVVFNEDITRMKIKEAVAKFKESFTKNELINYQDEPRRHRANPSGSEKKTFAQSIWEEAASRRYGRR